ncbi:uncharacterized protein A1O5_09208 [Cladophialophora psammophila CBS 110553]|uniref:Uncharacterized protein n=1 Tax=Cladophialophora psammophila CBS 110553 TaxID=1182543 RepID=W9WTB3_9EURO|nr:uncharacterized protein A1O5_09208 [Cladophialophora psammophila CBS 110553]EXJ67861.1 hypothetical protein A1O5_09208 [Cladophialophora psammophila CBS 110553]
MPEAAHPAVQLQRIQFTGGLLYDENGTLYRNVNAEAPTYVGTPSQDIDAEWEALIHDRYTPLTSSEAFSIGLESFSLPSKQSYWAGVDVFHSLHCINYVRMVLDLDYYGDRLDPLPIRRLHVGQITA